MFSPSFCSSSFMCLWMLSMSSLSTSATDDSSSSDYYSTSFIWFFLNLPALLCFYGFRYAFSMSCTLFFFLSDAYFFNLAYYLSSYSDFLLYYYYNCWISSLIF